MSPWGVDSLASSLVAREESIPKHGLDATIFKYRKHVFLERSVVGSDFVEVCGCLSRFLSLLTNSSPSTPCCELVYVLRLRCGLAIDLIKLGLRCC